MQHAAMLISEKVEEGDPSIYLGYALQKLCLSDHFEQNLLTIETQDILRTLHM